MDLNEAKKILKENGIICEDGGKDWASITSSKIAEIDAIEYTWSETKGNHFIQFNHRIGDPTTLGVFYRPNESRDGSVRIFKADNGKDKLFTPENSTPDEVAKAVKKAKLEAADQYIIRFAVEDTNSEKVKNAIYKFVTEFAKQVDSWDFGDIKHKFKPVSYKVKDDEYIFIRCAVNDIYGNIEELDKFWNRNIKTMEKAGVYTMNATFRETDFDNYKPFEEEKNEVVKVNKGENNMDLNEAKQILERNGYICEGFMDKLKLKKDKFFGQDKYNEDLAAELQDVSITDYSKILQVFADYGFEDELKKAGNWNDFDPDEPGEFWACLQDALGWKLTAFSSGDGDGSWVNINGKKCKSAYQAYVAMQNGKYEG